MRAPLLASLLLASPLLAADAPPDASRTFLGTWHGTSTCTNRQLAPACQDEVVVYDVTPGAKTGVVNVKADKVVNGERQNMGDLVFTWDAAAKEWTSDYENPRVHVLWRLRVNGDAVTGTLEQLPGKATIRRIALRRSATP